MINRFGLSLLKRHQWAQKLSWAYKTYDHSPILYTGECQDIERFLAQAKSDLNKIVPKPGKRYAGIVNEIFSVQQVLERAIKLAHVPVDRARKQTEDEIEALYNEWLKGFIAWRLSTLLSIRQGDIPDSIYQKVCDSVFSSDARQQSFALFRAVKRGIYAGYSYMKEVAIDLADIDAIIVKQVDGIIDTRRELARAYKNNHTKEAEVVSEAKQVQSVGAEVSG